MTKTNSQDLFVQVILDQLTRKERASVTVSVYCGVSLIEFKDSKGRLHREGNKPARIGSDYTQEWFVNGRRCRTNGPAVRFPAFEEWWVDGHCFKNETEFLKSKNLQFRDIRHSESSTEELSMTLNGKKYRVIPIEE